MRVLVANIPLPTNRFLVDLNDAMSLACDLRHSSDAFWSMEGCFDIVHLHFPHYLTYELERASQTTLSDELVAAVEERLRFWSARARIVVTRHVLLPHDAEVESPWEKMYEMVFSWSDGVVHFGRASIEEFEQRYADTRFARGTAPRHIVIPHHNYCSLPNLAARGEARARLGIRESASVVLVFGAIRSSDEQQLIMDAFRELKRPRKVLLASTWRERLPEVGWIRLKYWIRDLKRLYFRFHPSYHFRYDFVPEEETQIYLNSADVLFIPRLRVLNSGNVTLGMTFGRVVVGPDSLDVGEILRETGNPVFDPEAPATAARALERAFDLAEEGKIGLANRHLAVTQWTVKRCARMYLDFFAEIVAGTPA